MSRLTIPKNPLQDLDQDYTRLPFFSSSIDIQGHITQKPDFSIAPSLSSLTHTFSLHWGNLNPFGSKSPKTVQIWLKVCPLTKTSHESSDLKEPVKTVHICCYNTSSQHPLQIKVLNLNKKRKKWKKNYDLSIMHLGYLNESKPEKSPSKKREWPSKKKNLKWLIIFFKELPFNQVFVFEMTNGHLSLSSHYYENYPLVVHFWAW